MTIILKEDSILHGLAIYFTAKKLKNNKLTKFNMKNFFNSKKVCIFAA